MRHLTGKVSSRFKAAGPNLDSIKQLILERTGLPGMARGTLNVSIPEEYIVRADTVIEPHEYIHRERLKLQRCRVRGHRMFIMRPQTHEMPGGLGARVLELISPIPLRQKWGLKDGDDLTVEVEGGDDWWAAPEAIVEDVA